MGDIELTAIEYVERLMKEMEEELENVQSLTEKMAAKGSKRVYNRMRRRHRKEWRKLMREDRPWDFEYIFDMLATKLRHMCEYFSLGYNVYTNEKDRAEIIHILEAMVGALIHRNDAYFEDEVEPGYTDLAYDTSVKYALALLSKYYHYLWD